MTRILFALSLGFVGVILATRAGFAAPPCAARDIVVGQMAGTCGAARSGIGPTGTPGVVELSAFRAGSRTLALTLPGGRTCLIASGQGCGTPAQELPAGGDPA